METVLRPENEALRPETLYRYLQLDSERDEAFDLLTDAAAEICGVPFAAVRIARP